MLRLIEERWERSRKSSQITVALEDLTHQNTDIGVECSGGSDGEHLSRELSADEADEAVEPDINVQP